MSGTTRAGEAPVPPDTRSLQRLSNSEYGLFVLGVVLAFAEILAPLVYVYVSATRLWKLFMGCTLVYAMVVVLLGCFTAESLPQIKQTITALSKEIRHGRDFVNQLRGESHDVVANRAAADRRNREHVMRTREREISTLTTIKCLQVQKWLVIIWYFNRVFMVVPIGVIFTTEKLESAVAIYLLYGTALYSQVVDVACDNVKTLVEVKEE